MIPASLQASAGPPAAPSVTRQVRVELMTGGALSGLVVDHDAAGLVVVKDETPYVFAWCELTAESALSAKRELIHLRHGEGYALSAADHFQLGRYALSRGAANAASLLFREAKRLDAGYAEHIHRAIKEANTRQAATTIDHHPLEGSATDAPSADSAEQPPVDPNSPRASQALPAATRAKLIELYKQLGAKVRATISADVVLVETEHFLIWTDWQERHRSRLATWCESMYAALCAQFAFSSTEPVFLAKCPIYCFRSKAPFEAFAKQFDEHDGSDAVGYTRSVVENGHVHIVLIKQGRKAADFDRFAATLVHEGTHAFLHRAFSSRLIPHWINEGYAELMVERVLGDRSHTAETAALLAKQYVAYDWSVSGLLESSGPIAVHEYPLAHSIVAHLDGIDHGRFVTLIRRLKDGDSLPRALATAYDGLTLKNLERDWRAVCRE